MKNTVLKCTDLYKSFGKKQILKGVSLDIEEGDILGFIGPNGAGKTTTIKLILGLQSISKGEVLINGYNVTKDFRKAIIKVGAIVENPDLYMYLTGYKNLELLTHLYKGIDKKRIDEVVKIVGLEKRIHDKVSKYSLGMRQRLGIAQAILHQPNLLILDEPTNGLDPEGMKEIRELLKKLAKEENMAILISSHNLAEIEHVCDKICIIKNGVVVEESSMKDIKKIVKDTSYIFEVSSTKNIEKIIKNKVNIIDDNTFKAQVTKEEASAIAKVLVKENIDIYTMREEDISLEEAFLKKTGGNIID